MTLHFLHLGRSGAEGWVDARVEGRVENCVEGRVNGRIGGCVEGRVGGLEKHEPIVLKVLKMDGSL